MLHSAVSFVTDSHQDVGRLISRLKSGGGSPGNHHLPAHASAYAKAAQAVSLAVRRKCPNEPAAPSLVDGWVASARAFEAEAFKADKNNFAATTHDKLQDRWDALTEAELAMSKTLNVSVDSVDLRVLAGRFRREQHEAFDRAVNARNRPGQDKTLKTNNAENVFAASGDRAASLS